jgi:uncharacterized damage-inducible protein DinB
LDALDLLRTQAATTNDLLTRVVADLTPAQAVWHVPGSTANPIAPTLLHVYFVEDRLVQRLHGSPPLFEQHGWRDKLGYDPDAPWSPLAAADPTALRAYAAEVRAATERYLAGLDPATLEQEIDAPRGRRPLATYLSLLLVTHKATHTGEIAAALGSQGVKGFPF